jgi:hypothetical protein
VIPVTADLVAELAERASRADFPQLEKQLCATGYCARPVRLRGEVEICGEDGRWRSAWSTLTEPDGVLRKACGNRREAVCPACAERYRQDAYHLIAAGMRGGKGVPDTILGHPAVFVTLTAPSFGPVHTRRLGKDGRPLPCRPRRDAPTCPHGNPLSCGDVHEEGDSSLGEPLCVECFDHQAALVWNNTLPKLWQRTTTYLPRTLAFQTNRTQARLRELVRFNYIKVAEYQRRGLVHLHVLVRLDRAMPKYREDELHPPSRAFTAERLERAVRSTIATVDAPVDDELGGGRVRWGGEFDVRGLDEGAVRGELAGYLAKYATKSTEQAGGVLHRISEDDVDRLAVSPHVLAYLKQAFELDRDPALAHRRFGAYAHALGYRGHCLTKSRRYSTTFKALRQEREAFVHEQLLRRSSDRAQRAIAAAAAEERRGAFELVGVGHFTAVEDFLAEQGRAREREARRIAHEERLMAAAGAH